MLNFDPCDNNEWARAIFRTFRKFNILVSHWWAVGKGQGRRTEEPVWQGINKGFSKANTGLRFDKEKLTKSNYSNVDSSKVNT